MPECKFCKEIELEWFFHENTSKYKLGRKLDDNNYIPHECKKFKPKNGCPNAKSFTETSLWMDIHKFRERDEIKEELEILTRTVNQFKK